jgi:hypothetical protein
MGGDRRTSEAAPDQKIARFDRAIVPSHRTLQFIRGQPAFLGQAGERVAAMKFGAGIEKVRVGRHHIRLCAGLPDALIKYRTGSQWVVEARNGICDSDAGQTLVGKPSSAMIYCDASRHWEVEGRIGPECWITHSIACLHMAVEALHVGKRSSDRVRHQQPVPPSRPGVALKQPFWGRADVTAQQILV